MTRDDLQELAAIRLSEAKLLLSAGASDGAFYLAGYAIECALKAAIAKSTGLYDFPELKRVKSSYTHDARELIVVGGLKSAFADAMRQSEFAWRWEIVVQWSEESRYRTHSPEEARDLIEAIENREHGILQWLKKHY